MLLARLRAIFKALMKSGESFRMVWKVMKYVAPTPVFWGYRSTAVP